MPSTKKKMTTKPGVLIQASKVNVFQVSIFVLLCVVAGVVYKVYSHGASFSTVKSISANYSSTVSSPYKMNYAAYTISVDGNYRFCMVASPAFGYSSSQVSVAYGAGQTTFNVTSNSTYCAPSFQVGPNSWPHTTYTPTVQVKTGGVSISTILWQKYYTGGY